MDPEGEEVMSFDVYLTRHALDNILQTSRTVAHYERPTKVGLTPWYVTEMRCGYISCSSVNVR